MIEIVRYDHISMAVPALDPQVEIMQKLFGFRPRGTFESDEGYVGVNLQIPGRGSLSWEVIAPRDRDSYLHRFLAGPSGPGLHHVALQVASTAQASEAIRQQALEPWTSPLPEDDPNAGAIYLHPREGGRGILWQLYASDDGPRQDEPFDDAEETTLGIIGVNHLAHATPDRDELAAWYEQLFGCRTVWASPTTADDDGGSGFLTRVVEARTGQIRFEAIQPAGDVSFIARFLDRRGETMHHVTFEVGDWERAMAVCRAQRIALFGERSGVHEGGRWSEAFLHPQSTGGVLVQLFWQEHPGVWI